jgi:3-oxoacyl-[acyl-carrier-protein] synthase-3
MNMASKLYSIISGTGSYIPTKVVKNSDFLENEFYNPNGEKFDKSNEEIIQKFEEITGIEERRHVTDDLVASDIAFFAANDAFESSMIDRESLDYIIVAHNFGDVDINNKRSDLVPGLAARVKNRLRIENPKTIAYDISFGCPTWLQGIIQADYYIKSGDAKRIIIIGAETLSRISDPHDMDSMLYSDGAGAVIIEARESEIPVGILSHAARSDAIEHAHMLQMKRSYNPEYNGNELFLKMQGHKLYEYALKTVHLIVKESVDKAKLNLVDINKVLIHQANQKMDDAILRNLFRSYGIKEIPNHIMPMTISWLGNSSVATLPTLLDLLLKEKLNNHGLRTGDNVVFASVGAGMNINSVVYKMP